MASRTATPPVVDVDEVQAYIKDMLRQLALMAADIGDERTAAALSEILADDLPWRIERLIPRRR